MSEAAGPFGKTADNFDIVEFAKEQARIQARMLQTGMEIADEKFYRQIRALERAYQQAVLNPQTKIPTPLTAVMHSLFGMLPERYVDAMVKREQLERHEGKPEHDMTTRGATAKAGQ